MRILLAGQKEFGAAVLRMAKGLGHEIAAVCCPTSNGRGGTDRTADAAVTLAVPVLIPSGTLCAATMPPNVDLIVAAHSHDFISRKTRLRARLGAIGYHPSLLPRHRGRDAIAWAIKMRDVVTGGTAYWLSETMDGGPIACQDWRWIRQGDTPASLWRRELFGLGLELLRRVLTDPDEYKRTAVPQDETLATFEPSCNPPPVFRPDRLGIEYSGPGSGPGDRQQGPAFASCGGEAYAVDGWPGYAWKAGP